MKLSAILFVILFTTNLYAALELKVEFNNYNHNKTLKWIEKVEMFYDEVKIIKIPNSNKQISLKVTDKIPEVLIEGLPKSEKVFISVKVFEHKNGHEEIISRAKLITRFNREASLETYKGPGRDGILTSLKVYPTKL